MSPECANPAECLRAEPVRCAWAARQEQYRRTNDRKQQILVSYKRESMRANMKAQRGFIFPWAMLLNPTVLLGIALAAASGFGYLQTVRLGAAQDRLIASQARFDQFRATVQAEGKLALERVENQRKQDLQRQEKANAQNKATVRLLNQRIASMRHDADSSGRYRLPAPEAGSKRPDLACFDRAELERADREVLGRLRASADQGDAATLDLNTAKEWAQKP